MILINEKLLETLDFVKNPKQIQYTKKKKNSQ